MKKNYFKPAMRVVELKNKIHVLIVDSVDGVQSNQGLRRGGSDAGYEGEIR